jgi:acyl-homoserine-lactone acylase
MLWRSILLVLLIAIPAILRAQEAEILWDSWDVPHIYASNDAGAFYGVGWAQAESYGHAILAAYVQTRGEASHYLGDDPAQVDSDRRVRTLNVTAVAQEWARHGAKRRPSPKISRPLSPALTIISCAIRNGFRMA